MNCFYEWEPDKQCRIWREVLIWAENLHIVCFNIILHVGHVKNWLINGSKNAFFRFISEEPTFCLKTSVQKLPANDNKESTSGRESRLDNSFYHHRYAPFKVIYIFLIT